MLGRRGTAFLSPRSRPGFLRSRSTPVLRRCAVRSCSAVPRTSSIRGVRVPEREAEVLADVDVVVAGGGPAGLGAAIAAGRLGARVVLCERYGFLGGNLTVAAVGTICGLYVG